MPRSETYDYVVVGAGSAGAVVAARLTEDPGTRVLLLEAGGPADGDEIGVPAAFPMLFKTRWDWNYSCVAQQQLDGARPYWPRMKALGGCSAMNAMIYVRGNRADYDTWRDRYGALGWGYDDVLPYFVKAEGNTRLGAPYHGQDGPLHVEDRRYTHPLSEAWVDSAVASGLERNHDFNGAQQEGVGLYQVTCRRGRRWSVDNAYLRPAADRGNLTVRTGALASRVLLQRGRAVGVAYLRGTEERLAYVDREVVLSGGTVNTPQLLMLSGIGPAAHLRAVGADVVIDLPGVGANLHDHPAVPLVWHSRGTTDLAEHNTLLNLARAKLTGTGPLVSNVGEAGGFLRSREGLTAPDVQAHFAPGGFWDNGLHEPTSRRLTVAATLVDVASRGRIRLRSTDPRWHPEIDPAYYADPADLDAMLAGCRRLAKTVLSGPLARFVDRPAMPAMPAMPGVADPRRPTGSALLAHVRQRTQTLYHPVGTCAMGSGTGAVVDPELRVRGVDGLRVADASVIPVVPRGNTNAPVVMIGEKAADLLRGESA